jgi:holliday junction DNA helicase RuvA
MIGTLRGTVGHREPDSVIVDVHGVGYLVHVSASEDIPSFGEPVELCTLLHVREDALTLYGFRERATLELFRLLLTSSGVGPRLALAALATHRADVLRTAIARGDVPTLTLVPGIGRKVAERLVLELADKVGVLADAPIHANDARSGDSPAEEVRDALVGLGYRPGEVAEALDEIEVDGADSAALLRRALQHLGSAGSREQAR